MARVSESRFRRMGMIVIAAGLVLGPVLLSASRFVGAPVWENVPSVVTIATGAAFAYVLLFHVVVELELDEHSLRWKTPLSAGAVTLNDDVEIRTVRGVPVMIVQRHGPALLVVNTPELRHLAAARAGATPAPPRGES